MRKDKAMFQIPFEEIKKDLKVKTVQGKRYYYLHTRVNFSKGTKFDRRRKDFYVGPVDVSEGELRNNICFALRKVFLDIFDFINEVTSRIYRSEYLSEEQKRELNFLNFGYNILLYQFSKSDLERYEEAAYTKYVYGTTSIEGNTYTLRETDMTLNEGLTVGGKEKREFFEIENYGRLQKYLERSKEVSIDADSIKKVHSLIMQNIDDESAGQYRRIDVGIRGASFTPVPAMFVEEEMDNLIEWYRKEQKSTHPVEVACTFHQRFEEIHPFRDGNGRVGRELLRIMLKKAGFPAIFIDKRNREEYLKSLDEGNKGDHSALCNFIVANLIETHNGLFQTAVSCFKDDFGSLANMCKGCEHKGTCYDNTIG